MSRWTERQARAAVGLPAVGLVVLAGALSGCFVPGGTPGPTTTTTTVYAGQEIEPNDTVGTAKTLQVAPLESRGAISPGDPIDVWTLQNSGQTVKIICGTTAGDIDLIVTRNGASPNTLYCDGVNGVTLFSFIGEIEASAVPPGEFSPGAGTTSGTYWIQVTYP